MNKPLYSEWDKIKKEEREKVYKAQELYCLKKELTIFVTQEGICFDCNKNYLDLITEKEASTELITFCKHCARSFVE